MQPNTQSQNTRPRALAVARRWRRQRAGSHASALLATAIAAMIAIGGAGQADAADAKATAAAPASVALFGSREFKRKGVHLLTKWADVLKRVRADARGPVCKNGNNCRLARWNAYVMKLKALSPMAQLRAVNRKVNSWGYVDDRTNYGRVDYWATPRETLARGGDCEDLVMAKYLALRALGWPDSKLRLVVVIDENLRLAHAVLSVQVGKTYMILDNQSRRVLDHRRIRHYRPIYSVNHTHWWFHKRPKPQKIASRDRS